jgi:ACS family hexuronate transporter-like MFS transporter
MPADTTPPPIISYSPWRWWVCVLLLLATVLNYMDRTALNQTSKQIIAAFDLDEVGYANLESAFVLAFGIGTLACGWLVDRVSVRWVYPALVLGWSAAGFLTGYATEVWFLFACRIALGLFEAGNWPCGIKTTRQVLRPAERSLGNSLFQSGTALGAILTPLVILAYYQYTPSDHPDAWRAPFRVIGLLGLVLVALWFLTLKPTHLEGPSGTGRDLRAESYFAIFRDVRFWILVVLVTGVNSSWHTARVWLPLYLQNRRGYSPTDVQWFSAAYYLFADVGSWAVGFGSLYLTWRGVSVHRSRVLAFAACTGLVLGSAAIPFLSDGVAITAVLFLFGCGALGLFPTYFALSQELSARHQGKVTATLGFLNSLYLAGMYRAEGVFVKSTGQYEWMLAFAGVPAAVALACVLLFWPKPAHAEPSP